MKRHFNPLRTRIVVGVTCLFAILAFATVYFQVKTLGTNDTADRRSRNLSSAQIVKLYIELTYQGDWEAHSGRLFRGLFEFVDGGVIRSELSDYLPRDTLILFNAGTPPSGLLQEAERSLEPPASKGPPPGKEPHPGKEYLPNLSVGSKTHRPDLPFATDNGVGIVVRDADAQIVGWISVSSGEVRKNERGNRVRFLFLIALAAILLAVISVFGFLVIRLTKPIDRMAEDTEAAKAKSVELASLSMTDHLTGLLNRRGLESFLEVSPSPPSHVAMLDIDHFKAVNDERGHDEGDRVLASVAEVLASCVRAGDLCCRWGGEEFIIAFRGAAGEHAEASAERIRAAVEARRFGSEGAPLAVTVTIGLAVWREGGFEETKASADAAMYRGKREGRNRVVVS